MKKISFSFAILVAMSSASAPVHAETKEEWIALGARIHGAFGPFIPVGIRIGLDAVDRLRAGPRDLIVSYQNGAKSPCPCIADGVMIATGTSPGQENLSIDPTPPADGMFAIITIRHKRNGATLRYSVSDEWLPKILAWRTMDASSRYDAAMNADNIFTLRREN